MRLIHQRLISTIVLTIYSVSNALAYDQYYNYTECLLCGDEPHFMEYFQDGNIFTLAVGLCTAILIALRWKRIKSAIRPTLLITAIILVLISGLLMLMGCGYRYAANLTCFLQICTVYAFIFVILSLLLIYWIKKLYTTKNIKQSIQSVRSISLKGFVSAPISIVISLGIFVLLQRIPYAWNFSQCEKYIESRPWIERDSNLKYKWESEHVLQWGGLYADGEKNGDSKG